MTIKVDPAPHSVVAVGPVRFGNRLPLALIAGPCALESRAHALEVAGAIGLLVPAVTLYAALLLVVVMAGAIIAHLSVLGGSPVPALALLLLSGGIAWLTRESADASRN